MIKEAIEKIESMTRPPTFTDGAGIERRNMDCSELRPPKESVLTATSLESAVEAAKSIGDSAVIECSFNGVDVREPLEFNGYKTNRWRCQCRPILPDNFGFGRFMPPDSFIIETSDFFVRDQNFSAMIALVSSITDVSETVVDDDGISQSVTFKNRVGRRDDGVVNPFLKLRSFRTFREVEQPEAEYLIRFKKGSNGPAVALFEASGYDWKIKATDAVYQYIKAGVGESITVIR